MTQAPPFSFECSKCGKTFQSALPSTPVSWAIEDDQLVCDDCVTPDPEPEEKAVPVRCETAIHLLSGAYIDLADPDCAVVTARDIAAGLRQPRFGAQTEHFYTVAQHSLLVLRLVSPLARKLGGEKGLQLRRCAFMHDAHEALIHDVVSPLKRQLQEYRSIEARLETRLADHFGFYWTDFRRDAVKRADIEALAIEQRDLKGSVDPWPIFDCIDRDKLGSIKITRCWHPDEAQERFLAAFEDLFPTNERKAA